MERRLLQLVVVLAGFVPVLAGGAGVLLGAAMVNDAGANLSADSHFRYLSGLLLAIGLAFWSTIPRIAAQTARFRLLTCLVVAGGLGRLVALGVASWWLVPRIERHTASVRLLTVLVFVGGLGRLLGLVMHGIPGPPMLGGLVMELVVTPAICLWQGRVGRT